MQWLCEARSERKKRAKAQQELQVRLEVDWVAVKEYNFTKIRKLYYPRHTHDMVTQFKLLPSNQLGMKSSRIGDPMSWF